MIREIRPRLCICASHHAARWGTLPGTWSTHTTLHTCSILYVNGGCHASRKNDARRHLIDMDADRDALSKAHPGEDRVDISDALVVGLRIRNVDRAGDAVDVAAHDFAIAHQLDLGRIAHPDRSEVRFLEIPVDPE